MTTSRDVRIWDGSAWIAPATSVSVAETLPDKVNNGGKFLTTDGVDTSWAYPVLPRTTATVTTTSLATNAHWTGTITLSTGFRLTKIATTRAARVRVYDTPAHLTADASRAVGTDPLGQHGVWLDYVTTDGALTGFLYPVVDGFSNESSPSTSIPIAVTNLGSSGTVTVTLTFVRTE